MIDQNRQVVASGPPDHPTSIRRLVFFLPLGGYWLLAVLTAFHPRPLWILSIFALPLVLTAAVVIGKFVGRA